MIQNGIIGSHNDHRLTRQYNKVNLLQDTGIDIIIDNNENDDNIKYCSIVQCKNGYKKGNVQWQLVIILTDVATTIENGIRGSVLCNTQYPVGMSTSVSWQV